MITEEEKEDIINKAVEKALLMIPEVVSNMMAKHVMLNKLNAKFYEDHPEFKDHKEIVASVVEMLDGKNPTDDYAELLQSAIPEIRKRIGTVKELNMIDVTPKPNRDFSATSNNGVI
jgi:hypothetical protein